jgi:hypothetical protein
LNSPDCTEEFLNRPDSKEEFEKEELKPGAPSSTPSASPTTERSASPSVEPSSLPSSVPSAFFPLVPRPDCTEEFLNSPDCTEEFLNSPVGKEEFEKEEKAFSTRLTPFPVSRTVKKEIR